MMMHTTLLNAGQPFIGAVIRELEKMAACPVTIRSSRTPYRTVQLTVLVFHTEHGQFTWTMPEPTTIEALVSATHWFRQCQQ